MKRTNNRHQKQTGAAIAFVATAIPMLIFVIGGAFYLATIGVAKEQIDGALKLVVLAASEAYVEYDQDECENIGKIMSDTIIAQCHQKKTTAALQKAYEVAARHTKILGSIGDSLGNIQAGSIGDEPFGNGTAVLIPERYSFEDPDGPVGSGDPCSGQYPCFHARGAAGNFANAFQLKADVETFSLVSFVNRSFGLKLPSIFDTRVVTAAAIPLRTMALIDISSSIAWDTHEPLCDHPAYPMENDISVSTSMNLAANWELLPPERGNPPAASPTPLPIPDTSGRRHYKDDYVLIETYDDLEANYDLYEDREYHKDPTIYPNSEQFTHNNSGANSKFLLDYYRKTDAPRHRGPEPWQSIYRAVAQTMDIFEQRSVAGDRAGIVFYHSGISWRQVVNLTNDYKYIKELLGDPRGLNNVAEPPAHANWTSGSLPWDASDTDMPKWMRLGLFPVPGTHTNVPIALTEAVNQFKEDATGIPSVDFVVHFGDGLASCFRNGLGNIDCDSSQYGIYRNAMKDIYNFAYESLFKNKITFHMFLFGEQVGPHTALIPHRSLPRCYTDEELRGQEPPIDFVKGNNEALNIKQESNNFPLGQDHWDAKDRYMKEKYPNSRCLELDPSLETDPSLVAPPEPAEPFFQANSDWYTITRLTGGRWFPIRPKKAGCSRSDSPPDCQGSDDRADAEGRLLFDPYCRNVQEQVSGYLNDLISTGGGFVIVDLESVRASGSPTL